MFSQCCFLVNYWDAVGRYQIRCQFPAQSYSPANSAWDLEMELSHFCHFLCPEFKTWRWAKSGSHLQLCPYCSCWDCCRLPGFAEAKLISVGFDPTLYEVTAKPLPLFIYLTSRLFVLLSPGVYFFWWFLPPFSLTVMLSLWFVLLNLIIWPEFNPACFGRGCHHQNGVARSLSRANLGWLHYGTLLPCSIMAFTGHKGKMSQWKIFGEWDRSVPLVVSKANVSSLLQGASVLLCLS